IYYLTMSRPVFRFDRLASASPRMKEVMETLKTVAGRDTTVLLQGESGTGKELAARAIHYNSPRKDKEFVVINCSAFSDTLLESELFGYMKGSFTGAVTEKKGLFEIADQGTFFLDEIGDMSFLLQVKILRVLQEGAFLKIGGVKPIHVNVRILAASNKDLKLAVEHKQFREDLYYRINVVKILLPPLRERREDIDILVEELLSQLAQRSREAKQEIDPEVMKFFMEYAWPGNIRELNNVVEHAAIMARGSMIHMKHLPTELLTARAKMPASVMPEIPLQNLALKEAKKRAADEVERRMILEALTRTRWNKSEAARLLEISRVDLMRKIDKYQFKKV
ncbi:MAG: sigma-54-dependent Fis family transcriptional regulator, partial [Candidatus Omnitrophica bacterium]|nr:sigma-54-dependent Fis family transcriptional regulator [Candidatus Omnitrophota bacterium]